MLKKLQINVRRHWQLYLLLAPTVAYFIIFHYGPMMGVQIALKNYLANQGIWGSPWVGLKHFKRFFASYNFDVTIPNTLLLSVSLLAVTFPFPILLALMLNQCRYSRFKKLVQTVTYAPHFISIVVLVSTMMIMFSPSIGIVNYFLKALGLPHVYFFGEAAWFRPMYVLSEVWQTTGWSSIVYLAALTSVDPSLHEAAMMDGATKFQRVRFIDLPCIMPTITIMLILACGRLMNIGYEKVLLMQTSLNLDASEVLSTYVYKVGLLENQFSYSTAINLFNSLINCVLLLCVNGLANKLGETSLW